MIWPWKHHVPRPPPAHEPSASAAIRRASAADQRAEKGLEEMREVTARIRHERERNHFAPAIFNAMRPK